MAGWDGRQDDVLHYGWVRVSVAGMVWFLILTMLGKTFLGDSFVIHTSSMEPTIDGRRDQGDRLLLSSLAYNLGEPQRWDIVLFRYPNNRTTRYMKRLVGLPGEQIMIRGGDLYLAPQSFARDLQEGLASGEVRILRKPRALQESLFKAFPVPFSSGREPFHPDRFWINFRRPEQGEQAWTIKAGEVRLAGSSLVHSRGTPHDVLHDPLTRAQAGDQDVLGGGEHVLGDLSFRLQARAEDSTGILRMMIQDPVARLDLEARVPADGSPATLLVAGQVQATGDTPFNIRGWHDLRLDNVDDLLRLEIDGEEIATCLFSHAPPPRNGDPEDAPGGIAFGASGGRFRLRKPQLFRDIYYTEEGQTRFLVPPGAFMFLGDNSPSSADSRLWRRVAIEVRATGQILSGDSQGVTLERRRPAGRNPWLEPDGRPAFVDDLGRVHHFDTDSEFRELGSWPSPYVPRRDILGRGMMILSPMGRVGFLR